MVVILLSSVSSTRQTLVRHLIHIINKDIKFCNVTFYFKRKI